MNSTETIDLSPLIVNAITIGDRRLKARHAIHFVPHLDAESEALFVIEDATLDICICAGTREELIDEMASHIFFAWDEYAKADPATLTSKAQELRKALLDCFEECP